MNSHPIDDVIVTLKCFEPPSVVLPITGDDLSKHLLIGGATGSGKTSIISEILYQLISYRADDVQQKIGLLILDAKGDDTPQRILHFAKEAGRENDVQILTADSTYFYDLFGSLHHLEEIDEYTERVLYASADMGRDNKFWSEYRASLVRLALTLLVVRHEQISFNTALDLMNQLFFGGALPDEANFLNRFLEKNEKHLTPFALSRLKQAQQQLKSWDTMESRTKANTQATLTNLIQPFMGGAAEHFFGKKTHRFNPAAVIEDGRILVVSISAISNPNLAPLLLRLIRSEFFAALQRRHFAHTSKARLAGLICDEYPLICSRDDVIQLQTIRSRRGFVIAATQGLQSLDHVVGAQTRDSLLLNFNSHIFLRSHEFALEHLAQETMGIIRVPVTGEDIDSGRVVVAPRDKAGFFLPTPICPVGTLSQLPAFHGFASFASGQKTTRAVWFATRFFESEIEKTKTLVNSYYDLASLRQNAQSIAGEQKNEVETEGLAMFLQFMKTQTMKLMLVHKHAPLFDPEALEFLLELYQSRLNREHELEDLISAFRRRTVRVPRGLETLPLPWMRAIRKILEKKLIKNPYMGTGMSYLGFHEGILLVTFNEEDENTIAHASPKEAISKLRVKLQMAMYPSLFRQPRRRDLQCIFARNPGLIDWFRYSDCNLKKEARLRSKQA